MKNELTTQPGLNNLDVVAERGNLENEWLAKIESNLKSIAQFRENSANIGPVLKAKFEKNITLLEKKNARLLIQIEDLKA